MTTIRRMRVPGHPAVDTDSKVPRTAGMPRRRDGAAEPVRLAVIDPPGADHVGRGQVAPRLQPDRGTPEPRIAGAAADG